ncbi:hypothetical protein BpHYR1_039810 [Brachionus plicatilis]|uniref:Uncharacterized protein n=1 Tax=Brachionus plicatilis TaxID=10195 RepID=A0A3M7PSQ8_BRAPC|nr:hypothetical protein BpHYR1_039810 [Brachionus plicatilis]
MELKPDNVVNFDKDLATDDYLDGENWKDDILNSVMDDTLSDDEEDDDCNDVIIDSAQTKKEVEISEIHCMIGEIRSYLTNNHPCLCKEFMTFESNLVDVANIKQSKIEDYFKN